MRTRRIESSSYDCTQIYNQITTMRSRDAALAVLVGITELPLANSLVLVQGPARTGASHTQFDSSTFVYYGPQEGFNVTGLVEYFDGDLKTLSSKRTKGKIVVNRLRVSR